MMKKTGLICQIEQMTGKNDSFSHSPVVDNVMQPCETYFDSSLLCCERPCGIQISKPMSNLEEVAVVR